MPPPGVAGWERECLHGTWDKRAISPRIGKYIFSIGQKGTLTQSKIIPESTTNTLYPIDSLQEGGPFGGLFRENGGSDQLSGITATHCWENPIPEVTAVTTPSTLEINARFQCIPNIRAPNFSDCGSRLLYG